MPANAFCQSMPMALGDCVRQQAGSYGRHTSTSSSVSGCDSVVEKRPRATALLQWICAERWGAPSLKMQAGRSPVQHELPDEFHGRLF